MSMVPLHTQDDPLYGDSPLEELAMVVQCKAFIAARRHLFHQHGVTRNQLREMRAVVMMRWHLNEHGLPIGRTFTSNEISWGLVELPHQLAEGQGRPS